MKILIITSCFAPKNIIGAVRISKIAKYLIRFGHDVTVISPVLEDYDKIDLTLECEELSRARRITVPYSQITSRLTRTYKNKSGRESQSDVGNALNNSWKSRMYRYLRSLFAGWRDFEWAYKVICLLRKDVDEYDLVFSSYPNYSTHKVAYYARKTGKAHFWIADFRDPIVQENDVTNSDQRAIRKQSFVVHNSDLSSFVSKWGTEHFVCDEKDRKKVIWLTNGYDIDDCAEFLQNDEGICVQDSVIFSYVGGLYKGERDCSPFFKAVHELIEQHLINENRIRLYYAGRDIGILKKQAAQYGVEWMIIDKGLIARKEAIELQRESDCVIVATDCYEDYGGALTGKIYEPIMMKKPVLLLVNGDGKNSEPGTFIKELKAGVVYEKGTDEDNVDKIKAMILEYISNKNNKAPIVSDIDLEKRDKYNYETIVKQLLQIINAQGITQ